MLKFKFWKENDLSKEYELTETELKEKYENYLRSKEVTWIMHYDKNTLYSFVGCKESVWGLNSVMELSDYIKLEECLWQTRQDVCNSKFALID